METTDANIRSHFVKRRGRLFLAKVWVAGSFDVGEVWCCILGKTIS